MATGEVDQAKVDALDKFNRHGPKVGHGFVNDKETKEKVPVTIHAGRYAGNHEYTIVDPKDRDIGLMTAKYYSEENLKELESSGKVPPNHEKLHYGEGKDKKYKSKVYIDSMQNQSRNQYSGVGKLMHQIAAEKSVKAGGEGRVQLTVGHVGGMGFSNYEEAGNSAGFHESFGYHGQDVYNPDGSLHHSGQSLNKKMAEDTWHDAQLNKRILKQTGAKGYWPPEGGIQKSPTKFMQSKDRPEMYLPDEAIEREKERMEKEPILDVNEETTDALIDKNKDLYRQEKRAQSEREANQNQLIPELGDESNNNFSDNAGTTEDEPTNNAKSVEDTDKELFKDGSTSTAFGDQPQRNDAQAKTPGFKKLNPKQQSLVKQTKENLEKSKKSKNSDPKKRDGSKNPSKKKSSNSPSENKDNASYKNGKLQMAREAAKNLKKKDKDKKSKGDSKSSGIGSKIKSAADASKDDGLSSKVAALTKKDPRAMAAGLADKYLHLGQTLGHILFLTWVIITILLSLMFVLPGLIGIFMLTLLLISPKLNYRITVWILEIALDAFGVGEIITAVNQVGLTKLKIRINMLEVITIILIDMAYIICLLALYAFIMSLTCWSIGGWSGTVASWLDQTGFVSTLKSICPAIPPQ